MPTPEKSDRNGLGIPTVCGISHHTATLSERESFQVNREELVPAIRELKSIRGIREGMILSTCNRFEAYMVTGNGEEPFALVRDFFQRFKGLDPMPLRRLFYVRHGSTAVRHLFRVTAGLDSLVLGEYQIQNQVKEAYSASCSVKAPGKLLHRLVHAAFRAGKAVRSRTGVGAGRMSVGGMAVEVFKERFSPSDRILLVGANENVRIVAEGLIAAGFHDFLFANRTAYKAEKMATRYGGKGYALDRLAEIMSECRGMLSCTGAPHYVVPGRLIERLVREKSCPELCIDIAVPRDIERPGDPSLPLQIFDLEDLKNFRDTRLEVRKEDLPAAKQIVEDMVCTFQSWMESAFEPGFGALVKEYERIRLSRLKEARAFFQGEDLEALERFSRDLVRDLLKVPVRTVMENAPPPPSHKSRE